LTKNYLRLIIFFLFTDLGPKPQPGLEKFGLDIPSRLTGNLPEINPSFILILRSSNFSAVLFIDDAVNLLSF